MDDSMVIFVIVAFCLVEVVTVAIFANSHKNTLRMVIEENRRERRRR